MFRGVQDVQDVKDLYILYQFISPGRNLHLYTFKMFRMFKIHILYAKFIQTDAQNSANIAFTIAVEHIEEITHNRSRNAFH